MKPAALAFAASMKGTLEKWKSAGLITVKAPEKKPEWKKPVEKGPKYNGKMNVVRKFCMAHPTFLFAEIVAAIPDDPKLLRARLYALIVDGEVTSSQAGKGSGNAYSEKAVYSITEKIKLKPERSKAK